MSRPADYPPPLTAADAIAEPAAPPEERIDVGVLVVGAGPAGLACAIRLGQLLEESPRLAERLGDVPIAVLDKGSRPGAHLLSGAVVNPVSLRRLFAGRRTTDDMPFLRASTPSASTTSPRKHKLRIPTPPPMRNHGNYVASVSQLGRWLAEEAEALGVAVLPETTAEKLLVSHGRVSGVRTADRGRGRDGEQLPRFEARLGHPGAGDRARRGHAGLSDRRRHRALRARGRAIRRCGRSASRRSGACRSRSATVIHTMGWPLRGSCEVPRVRRLVHLPDGRGHGHARAWSSGSTTATSSCPSTTCSRS